MSTNELREAAERLRRWDAGEAPSKIYPPEEVFDRLNDDAIDLARAYLAEHPPDDDTPIDEGWLLAVGAVRSVTVPDAMRLSHDDDIYFVPQFDLSWLPAIQNGLAQWIKLRRITTRGQLRRLCSSLGIELKEGKA